MHIIRSLRPKVNNAVTDSTLKALFTSVFDAFETECRQLHEPTTKKLEKLFESWISGFLLYVEGTRTPDEYIRLTSTLYNITLTDNGIGKLPQPDLGPYHTRITELNQRLREEYEISILPSWWHSGINIGGACGISACILGALERALPQRVVSWDEAQKLSAQRILSHVKKNHWRCEVDEGRPVETEFPKLYSLFSV